MQIKDKSIQFHNSILYDGTSHGSDVQLDTRSLPTGIYFIRIAGETLYTFRVLKIR
jgi:hypothetical protein